MFGMYCKKPSLEHVEHLRSANVRTSRTQPPGISMLHLSVMMGGDDQWWWLWLMAMGCQAGGSKSWGWHE